LITCGTKLKLVQSPATMPRAVGHHDCIVRFPACAMIKNSPKVQEFPTNGITERDKDDAPRAHKVDFVKVLRSLASSNPLSNTGL
jgi:hypothetical protein